jgi:hypothetical protein
MNFTLLTSCTKISYTQLTCRGAPGGYPRVEEILLAYPYLEAADICESLTYGEDR